MVCKLEKELTYLVLSVDCVEEANNLKLVFENEYGIEGEEITIDLFIQWINKIKFSFMIIFGSKSERLSE
jgi:hypothetical protein